MEQTFPLLIISIITTVSVILWLRYGERYRRADDGMQTVYNYSPRKWLAAELEEKRRRDARGASSSQGTFPHLSSSFHSGSATSFSGDGGASSAGGGYSGGDRGSVGSSSSGGSSSCGS